VRLLFVNPTHPFTPHISGTRAWRFAEELAKSGHQVVLLCATLNHNHTADDGGIEDHDWRKPFVLACDPDGTNRVGNAVLSAPVRKAVTVWSLLLHGGTMRRWATMADTAARRLFDRFRPDVVWATFGRMEAVFVARRVAYAVRCPWVLDIKDNWELYVPAGLRRMLVARTKGWAALTANSCFTQEKARIWQGTEATVIYSGVDPAFFADHTLGCRDSDLFCINLVGGLYYREKLVDFVGGLKQWADSLASDERNKIQLRYLGGDRELFQEVASVGNLAIDVTTTGYIPVYEMAQHCRCCALNVYIAHGSGFHHKLLELLACGRPVIAYPTELEESRVLARYIGGELLTPNTPAAVASELARLHERWRAGGLTGPALESAREFSWAAQAKRLEKVLDDVAKNRDDPYSAGRNNV